jgi:hypothetical protein
MAAALPNAAAMAVSGMARAAVRAAAAASGAAHGTRLADSVPREIVDDIFAHALKKQTGVSLKYMVRRARTGLNVGLPRRGDADLGPAHRCRAAAPTPARARMPTPPPPPPLRAAGLWRQPHRAPAGAVRPVPAEGAARAPRAPRGGAGEPALRPQLQAASAQGVCVCGGGVAAVEGLDKLPPAPSLCTCALLTAHPPQVRDWYVESFRELRTFPGVKTMPEEGQFTDLLRHIYRRHVRRRGVGVAGTIERLIPAAACSSVRSASVRVERGGGGAAPPCPRLAAPCPRLTACCRRPRDPRPTWCP